MIPDFSFPDKIEWERLKHKVASELREFPAALHSTREYLGAVRESGDPIEVCDEAELESAKAAMQALELALITFWKHSIVPWKPGAKDSDLERSFPTPLLESQPFRGQASPPRFLTIRRGLAFPTGAQ